MIASDLRRILQRQRRSYALSHSSVVNLVIHAVTVPAFMAGNVLVPVAVYAQSISLFAAAFASMAFAIGVQALGHRLEKHPPDPFLGVGDAIARLFFEQWVTFPLYVAECGIAKVVRRKPR